MANDLREKANLDQQLANNSIRIKEMIDQQYNVEVTRSLVLCFSSPDEDSARSLGKALFAKGTRLLNRDPQKKADNRWCIRVGVKRTLRDVVREEFVADMVHTAAGMESTYDGWNLLTDEPAEQAQQHTGAPDGQDTPVAA
ncbi:MAG: hypothetical protein V4734_11395 [Terriglobus sp.]